MIDYNKLECEKSFLHELLIIGEFCC